jgi:hypothetical protein
MVKADENTIGGSGGISLINAQQWYTTVSGGISIIWYFSGLRAQNHNHKVAYDRLQNICTSCTKINAIFGL